jgi:methyl-accepting chemotaxis protein
MALLRNIRIGTRLVVCFSIIFVFLISISMVSISRMNALAETSRAFIDEDVKQVLIASDINIQAEAAALALLQILLTEDREQRTPLYKKMDSHNAAINRLMNELSESSQDELDLSQISKSRNEYDESLTATVELVELSAARALAHYRDNTQPKLNKLLSNIASLLEQQQMEMHNKQRFSEQSNGRAVTIVIGLSVTALVLVGLLATLVSRSIVGPLRKTVSIAQKIAGGDLRQLSISLEKDEIGDLEKAFEIMCRELNHLISSIHESAKEITLSTAGLSDPVSSVQDGSGQQRQAVTRIEQSVAAFANDSARAVRAAAESKEQAERAMNLASEGKILIDRTTVEFDNISTTISNSASVVESLRDHAVSVSNLVSSVREIAEQTNLLALNAAIEAARAGESGRGFSVVADEVRNLAGRASRATSEIDEVIESIVSETKTAADQIGLGRKEMEEGVTLLQQLVQPLNDLSTGAQVSFEQLRELEQAVSDQSEGSNGITVEVQQIAIMASDNSEAVSLVTRATTRLNELSNNLAVQTEKFRI